jgi:type I protein arginine methyltransferase
VTGARVSKPAQVSRLSVGSQNVGVSTRAEGGTPPAVFPSFGEYPVYDDHVYQIMTGDAVRNDAFREALRGLVAGRRVLDIGTGAHLKWARESLALGAACVVGIEAMAESFATAQRVKRDAGLGDQLRIVHGLSTGTRLAERAEVCVAEIVGSLAGAEGAAAVIADARRRLLSPDCVVVPHRAATRVAAVALHDVLAGHPVAFSPEALPHLQKIFAWNGGPFDVRLRIERPYRAMLLSDSAEAEVLEFNGDLRTHQERVVELFIDQEGVMDGLLAYMQLWCSSNSDPIDTLRDETNWGAIYFPLFDEAVPRQPGDCLRVLFRVRPAADGVHPLYHVAGTLVRGGRAVMRGRHLSNFGGRRFRQQALYRTLFPL